MRPEPAFAVSPHFAQVVTAAFSHRRKTLRNALRGLVSLEQGTITVRDLERLRGLETDAA